VAQKFSQRKIADPEPLVFSPCALRVRVRPRSPERGPIGVPLSTAG